MSIDLATIPVLQGLLRQRLETCTAEKDAVQVSLEKKKQLCISSLLFKEEQTFHSFFFFFFFFFFNTYLTFFPHTIFYFSPLIFSTLLGRV